MQLGVFAGLHSGNVVGDGVVAGEAISVWWWQLWCLVLWYCFSCDSKL